MFEKVVVKYDNQVHEFSLSELDLANPGDPTDSELMQALCLQLDVASLSGYAVYRADTVINVGPNAQYG